MCLWSIFALPRSNLFSLLSVQHLLLNSQKWRQVPPHSRFERCVRFVFFVNKANALISTTTSAQERVRMWKAYCEKAGLFLIKSQSLVVVERRHLLCIKTKTKTKNTIAKCGVTIMNRRVVQLYTKDKSHKQFERWLGKNIASVRWAIVEFLKSEHLPAPLSLRLIMRGIGDRMVMSFFSKKV